MQMERTIETVKWQKQLRKVLHTEYQRALWSPLECMFPQGATGELASESSSDSPNLLTLEVLSLSYAGI